MSFPWDSSLLCIASCHIQSDHVAPHSNMPQTGSGTLNNVILWCGPQLTHCSLGFFGESGNASQLQGILACTHAVSLQCVYDLFQALVFRLCRCQQISKKSIRHASHAAEKDRYLLRLWYFVRTPCTPWIHLLYPGEMVLENQRYFHSFYPTLVANGNVFLGSINMDTEEQHNLHM